MTCSIEQNLCAIAKGDKVTLPLKFVQPDTAPLNISGNRFEMTFKAKTGGPVDLKCSVIFPKNELSVAGKGFLILAPGDTNQLIEDETYDYKFRLYAGTDDVFTIGSGKVTIGNVGRNPGTGLVFKTCCNTLVFEVGFVSLPTYLKGDQGKPGITGRPGLPGRDSIIPGKDGNKGDKGEQGIPGIAGSGTGDFIGLIDTPSIYLAQAHKLTRVNAAAKAVEFTDSINAGSF